MTNTGLYPPSVKDAPPDLTVPSSAYRRQVVIVLASLFVFVLFYLGLLFASGWLVVHGVEGMFTPERYTPDSNENWGPYIAITSFIIFLFLSRSLVKWRRNRDDLRIEVSEKQHPELFAFIRKICEETKAPAPLRVFLTPDVNASVSYNSSVLSLILPVKKNLDIGLGLVDGLNLSEFKAVIAHEFGHFSQSTMRIGSYVYVANHVVYDIVYQRDILDEVLAKARRTNIRIAIFAWAISGVLWVLRMIMQLAFKLINFLQSALSRQMEFHADLVAVSITGSDSLIHALKKLEFLSACHIVAYNELRVAAENKLYTRDFYYHQARAASYVRTMRKDPDAGIAPALSPDPAQKTQVFKADEEGADQDRMWASHPSNYDREQNAKLRYVRSIVDERSPWLLFSNDDVLRTEMTKLIYKHALEVPAPVLAEPEQVQRFIDEENAEMDQNERYEGMYDGRPFSIKQEELDSYYNDPELAAMGAERIAAISDKLYNATYKEFLEAYRKRRIERAALATLQSGGMPAGDEVKIVGSKIEFRGEVHSKSDLDGLIEKMTAELEPDGEWLKVFDRDVFKAHVSMAQLTGDDAAARDLFARYSFHLQLQTIMLESKSEMGRLHNIFGYLGTKSDGLSKAEFADIAKGLEECRNCIKENLAKANSLALPALQNVEPGAALGKLLLQEPLVEPLAQGAKIETAWLSALANQASQIDARCNRIFFKSLGSILANQELIAERYKQYASECANQPCR